jgi:hypothetical protein
VLCARSAECREPLCFALNQLCCSGMTDVTCWVPHANMRRQVRARERTHHVSCNCKTSAGVYRSRTMQFFFGFFPLSPSLSLEREERYAVSRTHVQRSELGVSTSSEHTMFGVVLRTNPLYFTQLVELAASKGQEREAWSIAYVANRGESRECIITTYRVGRNPGGPTLLVY